MANTVYCIYVIYTVNGRINVATPFSLYDCSYCLLDLVEGLTQVY